MDRSFTFVHICKNKCFIVLWFILCYVILFYLLKSIKCEQGDPFLLIHSYVCLKEGTDENAGDCWFQLFPRLPGRNIID